MRYRFGGVEINTDTYEPRSGGRAAGRTVTDLVAGCGLAFTPGGEHHLDGLPQPWAVYEVAV